MLPLIIPAVATAAFLNRAKAGEVAGEKVDLQKAGEELLKWLDLSQTQVASLLGVSPQAISKELKDHGPNFLLKDGRAQRLYSAMQFIGGAYAMPTLKLKEWVSQLGIGGLEGISSNSTRASDLYLSAEELWIFSDTPGKIVDWDAMKEVLFTETARGQERVVVFFLNSLEGAEEWAEVLEREAIKRATKANLSIDVDAKEARYSSYIYLVVTNIAAFSGEFVITNPGSRCMGVNASQKKPSMHFWNGASYTMTTAGTTKALIQAVHRNELGQGALKAHFFPAGDRLNKEKIDFPPRFIDGLIGKLGQVQVGGVLRESSQYPEGTVEFNNRRKFTPAFLLAYKRKPGESFNHGRSLRIVQDEIDKRRKEEDGPSAVQSADW